MISYTALIGLRVQLRRTIDRPCGMCGESAVVIGLGAGPHAHSLVCAGCTRHRGWLPQRIADFLVETITHFGTPAAPININTIPKTDPEARAARDRQSSPCALKLKRQMKMLNNSEYQSMYGSRYLSAADVPKDGELLRAKIGKIELIELTDQKTNTTKKRLVAFFSGIEKPLIINKTNAKKLVASTGSEDRADWLGLLCEIYVEETQLGDGVRLRVIKTAAAAPKKHDPISSGPIKSTDLNDEIPPLA